MYVALGDKVKTMLPFILTDTKSQVSEQRFHTINFKQIYLNY